MKPLSRNQIGKHLIIPILWCATATAFADTTPPNASGRTTSPDCVTTSGNTCMVADLDFTIQVTPATDNPGGSGIDTDGYRICRSENTTGWGGCSSDLTWNGTTSHVVTGSDRPAPGQRRAYYFRSRDNAGNWGPWNDEMYIQTLEPDNTPPSQPGPTVSPDCVSTSGNTCFVNDTNFTIQVTPATDNSGGWGIDGYQICRSQDTVGWGGCNQNLTLNGSTSIVVSGSHRPDPGKRRAYYFRARDKAGNWGPWNDEMYIQTLVDDTPPSTVPGFQGKINGANVNGMTVTVSNPIINFNWNHASDDSGIERYQIVLNHINGGGWIQSPHVLFPNSTYTMTTSNLVDGGQYRIHIRAKDNAGNWGNFVNGGTFMVDVPDTDTTPPSTVPGFIGRINGTNISGLTVTVANPTINYNWNHATDASGIERYQIVLNHINGPGWVQSPHVLFPNTAYTMTTSGLMDGGQYRIHIRAKDNAGNWGNFVNSGTFTVDLPDTDTTPPSAVSNLQATIGGEPIAGLETTSTNPTIQLAWDHATDAGGIRRYQIFLIRSGTGTIQTVYTQFPDNSRNLTTSNLVIGGSYFIRIRAQDNADNWGPAIDSGTFTVIDEPLGANVNPRHELMITALPVVEDPVRTTGCGPWTFCTLMTELAGSQDPSLFALNFFKLWEQDQHISGDVVPAVDHVRTQVINTWHKTPNGGLDLTRSPFRLLAIVNRFDLVGPGDAGEARMVFGMANGSGSRDFTIIFEYKMSTQVMSRADWWTEWHRLNLHPNQSSAGYRDQLEFLTDSFSRTPVNGKITLGQIRSNDGLIFPQTLFWEWREFFQTSGGANIRQTTVKQTPRKGTDPVVLGNWINDHEQQLLNQTHVVGPPLQLGGHMFNFSFFGEGVNNPWARLNFSQATCGGCHVGETASVSGGAPFFHIPPRRAGQEATLSDFFFNVELCVPRFIAGDIEPCWATYVQNELGRRKIEFENRLRSIGFKANSSLKSFKPTYEPTDKELIPPGGHSRVH